jgi:hypothetical protein
MTLIERVARAIAVFHRLGTDYVAPDGSRHPVEPRWEEWTDHARAAIEAMREPTEAMIEAYAYDMYEPDPREQWQKMLDAGLKE